MPIIYLTINNSKDGWVAIKRGTGNGGGRKYAK